MKSAGKKMSQEQALATLAKQRGERIVVTTMSAVGIWPRLSQSHLDFAYLPSTMGQGASLGLGLALAQSRGVIVVHGDGSLLMNLGCLVTVANHPADLYIILMDNGIYEVTGGQPTAGSGHVDFAGMARAAGIHRVYSFTSLRSWKSKAAATLSGSGPVFVWLQVEARYGQKTPKPPRPMAQQIRRLKDALDLSGLPSR